MINNEAWLLSVCISLKKADVIVMQVMVRAKFGSCLCLCCAISINDLSEPQFSPEKRGINDNPNLSIKYSGHIACGMLRTMPGTYTVNAQ